MQGVCIFQTMPEDARVTRRDHPQRRAGGVDPAQTTGIRPEAGPSGGGGGTFQSPAPCGMGREHLSILRRGRKRVPQESGRTFPQQQENPGRNDGEEQPPKQRGPVGRQRHRASRGAEAQSFRGSPHRLSLLSAPGRGPAPTALQTRRTFDRSARVRGRGLRPQRRPPRREGPRPPPPPRDRPPPPRDRPPPPRDPPPREEPEPRDLAAAGAVAAMQSLSWKGWSM